MNQNRCRTVLAGAVKFSRVSLSRKEDSFLYEEMCITNGQAESLHWPNQKVLVLCIRLEF